MNTCMKLGIATLVISAGLGSGFLSQRYTQEQADSHSETLMDMIAIRSTLEGIAEYVSMRMTGTPRIRNPAYGLGFKVVQPILDVSVSAGIDYILTHMPSGNDLDITHRTAYQRKAIEEINQAK